MIHMYLKYVGQAE